MDVNALRTHFPLFDQVNPPAYLDNACVTLKPRAVIESIQRYYSDYPGCGGRSVHRFGTRVSQEVEQSRHRLQSFLNAERVDEIVFTRNATHSINQIAHGMEWEKGDVVLTTDREHNSNLVPWLQLEKEQGIIHEVIPSNEDNTFNLDTFESMCAEHGKQLKLVSLSHVGNLDGVEVPIQEATAITHDHGALMAVDGAQSTPHMNVDVRQLDIDFLSFSIHKMCGPTGMGGLWGRHELLDSLRPIQSGGQTVDSSSYTELAWSQPPARFEGGLGHFAGMIGTGAAIEFLQSIDLEEVHQHEIAINQIITNGIKDLPGISIIGPNDPSKRGGICSILFDTLNPHEVSMLLDEAAQVMVRSGQHCVHSWFNAHQRPEGSLRASAYLYNTEAEAKQFVDTLDEIVYTLS